MGVLKGWVTCCGNILVTLFIFGAGRITPRLVLSKMSQVSELFPIDRLIIEVIITVYSIRV